ncbi:MAG: ABC transporter ATP-binding protein [Bacteroidota bacterium]
MPLPSPPGAPASAPRRERSEPPAGVEIERVTKRFGDVRAVDDVSLSVAPGELVSLLGPSGSGKTTLLRLVGGFETPDTGTIRLGDRDVTHLSPQARPTATVFQSYALFPSMTVGENVGYGLRVQKTPRDEAARRITEALGMVGLGDLAGRRVSALSGGQQQRVALARALAVRPKVLLFDEPLSNLDAELRQSTRAEIRALQQALGTTALYVTHDQDEALALSDRMAVLRDGRLVAVGMPRDLYANPPTAFVAQFLGGANVVRGALAARLGGTEAGPGEALSIRPEHLVPSSDGVPARLVTRQFLGREAEWVVEVDGATLRLAVSPDQPVPPDLRVSASRATVVRDDLAAENPSVSSE